MPNWCENRVEIYADTEEQAAEIAAFLKGDNGEFDFSKLVPMPDLLRNTCSGSTTLEIEGQEVTLTTWWEDSTVEDYAERHKTRRPFTLKEQAQLDEIGADNWYDWSCTNWGTKWNACHIQDTEHDGECLTYRFDTAWAPPEPIYYALRERFPDVGITWFYHEPGMQFAGYLNAS